jgi:hypothetical protein
MMMEKKKGKKTLCAAFQFMITNEISHSQAWGLPFFFPYFFSHSSIWNEEQEQKHNGNTRPSRGVIS